MVDPIGIKPAPASDRRTAPVGSAAKVAAPAPVQNEAQAQASGAARISQDMAESAPVDAERVSRIKKAIEDGRFPLVPSTIADRLLALKLDWNPNDKA